MSSTTPPAKSSRAVSTAPACRLQLRRQPRCSWLPIRLGWSACLPRPSARTRTSLECIQSRFVEIAQEQRQLEQQLAAAIGRLDVLSPLWQCSPILHYCSQM